MRKKKLADKGVYFIVIVKTFHEVCELLILNLSLNKTTWCHYVQRWGSWLFNGRFKCKNLTSRGKYLVTLEKYNIFNQLYCQLPSHNSSLKLFLHVMVVFISIILHGTWYRVNVVLAFRGKVSANIIFSHNLIYF